MITVYNFQKYTEKLSNKNGHEECEWQRRKLTVIDQTKKKGNLESNSGFLNFKDITCASMNYPDTFTEINHS